MKLWKIHKTHQQQINLFFNIEIIQLHASCWVVVETPHTFMVAASKRGTVWAPKRHIPAGQNGVFLPKSRIPTKEEWVVVSYLSYSRWERAVYWVCGVHTLSYWFEANGPANALSALRESRFGWSWKCFLRIEIGTESITWNYELATSLFFALRFGVWNQIPQKTKSSACQESTFLHLLVTGDHNAKPIIHIPLKRNKFAFAAAAQTLR